MTGFATDPEVEAGRRGPEVAPAAREHTGASHLPRPQERHDLVEERIWEVTEAVNMGGYGAGAIRLSFEDGVDFGFLLGHLVEQVACTSALDGRAKLTTRKFLGKLALRCTGRTWRVE